MSPSCLILLLNRHKFTDYHFNINCFTLSLLSQRFLASTSPSCSFPMLVKVVGFVTYSRDIHLYLCGLPKSLTVTREAELLPAGPVLLLHPFSITQSCTSTHVVFLSSGNVELQTDCVCHPLLIEGMKSLGRKLGEYQLLSITFCKLFLALFI